jgi:hypothetical protein
MWELLAALLDILPDEFLPFLLVKSHQGIKNCFQARHN